MREKNHKKVFGLLGLATVASMTTVAASLPTPDAGAASVVSDSISVRVVSEQPSVYITNLKDGAVISIPQFDMHYNYDNVDNLTITVTYVDADGANTTHVLSEENLIPAESAAYSRDLGRGDATSNNSTIDVELGVATGSGSIRIDLTTLPRFGGYGYYTFSIYGSGLNASASDSVRILYAPVAFDPDNVATEEEDGGNPIVDFDVDENADIAKVEITIKDKNGEVINNTPIVCTDLDSCKIPFSDYQLPSGDYTLDITAFDHSGNQVGPVISIKYHYTVSELNPNAPKTGGQPSVLNIASEDFVATALVVFGLALAASFVLLKKRSRR